MVEHLYIHVPFCARKCAYCAFYSETTETAVVERYVRALIRELEMVAPDLRPRTVFFGGGTPSLLTRHQWQQILAAMDRLGLLGAEEWTIECNPATVSADKARLWRDYGVNRVSLGVQSLDPRVLERLGRIHSRQTALRSFDQLRRCGFDNINLDLMFAIPGQTLASWRQTVHEALTLQSEHLACYEIIYEEDTPLFEALRAGRFEVDEDLACAMYDLLIEACAAAGLRQYEVANFARDHRAPGVSQAHDGRLTLPDRACRHNVNYWRNGSYYGLGPAASGYVQGVRTGNWNNVHLYCDQLERGARAIAWEDRLSPLRRAGEAAAFGLRMIQGWAFDEFRDRTGYDLAAEWREEIDQLTARGWGIREPDRFRLSREGIRFADAAAQLFLR